MNGTMTKKDAIRALCEIKSDLGKQIINQRESLKELLEMQRKIRELKMP